MHAALLTIFVEETLQRLLHRFDLDTADPRHHLRHFEQLFARQAAKHGRSRLLAHAQQHDGSLLQRRSGHLSDCTALLASDIFLHPLLHDFSNTLWLLGRQRAQMINHHIDRRARRRQVVIFQERTDRDRSLG